MNRSEASTNKLLKALVVAGVISIAAVNPFFGVLASYVAKEELGKWERKKLENKFNYLKRRGFVKVTKRPNGSWVVRPTKEGRFHAQKYYLEEISIQKPAQWDKKWRIIVFDIPTDKKATRAILLAKLKNLGFIMEQKSVWAHPFECQKEINILAKALEIEKYTSILVCDSISSADSLRQGFEKRNNLKLT